MPDKVVNMPAEKAINSNGIYEKKDAVRASLPTNKVPIKS
jgi:hypothetical protein